LEFARRDRQRSLRTLLQLSLREGLHIRIRNAIDLAALPACTGDVVPVGALIARMRSDAVERVPEREEIVHLVVCKVDGIRCAERV